MAVPRFLPKWLGGEADRVDGEGVALPMRDALPQRPEAIDEPLPEGLERLLRDPELVVPWDRDVHALIARYLRKNPAARVTRESYLSLYAYLEHVERGDW